MDATSDSGAAYFSAVASTLGEKKAKCQALPYAGMRDLTSFRTTPRVKTPHEAQRGKKVNSARACNLVRSAHVFPVRAHCPRVGLSPRRGRAVIESLPCRL